MLLGLGLCACGRFGFDADAVATDASATDADADATATLDNTICDEVSTTLVCESFEASPKLGTIDVSAPDTIAIDSSRPYRGALSFHTHTEGSSSTAWRRGRVLGGVATGELHARWYVYIPAGLVQPISLTHLLSDVAPFDGVVFQVLATGVSVSYANTMASSAVPLPRDQWACVQVRIVVSAATDGLVETWIDGIPAARLDALVTLPPNGYWNVHTGHFSGGPSHSEIVDVWTDELVVSTAAIPCD